MKLYNDVELPDIGAGTYPYREELISLVPSLIDNGYRLFDSSDNYHNEEKLGEALSRVNTDLLDNVVIMTKYSWPQKSVKKAFDESSKKIFSNTITPNRKADIYLMHWPYPYLWERRWREMENLYRRGYCKAIGVCNFNEKNMERLLSICRVKPMINQFECHPMYQQRSLIELCNKEKIQVISYSPLARINKELFENELLVSIAKKHNKSVSQVILKWNISEGRIPIPASGNVSHMKENHFLSDFKLDDNEIKAINSLERGMRIRFDPDTRFSQPYRICFFFYSKLLNVISKDF